MSESNIDNMFVFDEMPVLFWLGFMDIAMHTTCLMKCLSCLDWLN